MANATEESAVDTGPVGAEIEDERRAEAFAGEPPFKVQPSGSDRVAAALKDAGIAGLDRACPGRPDDRPADRDGDRRVLPDPELGSRSRLPSRSSSSAGCILNLFVWDRATADQGGRRRDRLPPPAERHADGELESGRGCDRGDRLHHRDAVSCPSPTATGWTRRSSSSPTACSAGG